ncbi:MAG: Tm-1-like ATP-binding domain-containing protein, partial [Deltaproteobacteria bacterium]|nr:Tm-1-like ATP-binding domain-containing protein [Deltaproteobacteria bacterium]
MEKTALIISTLDTKGLETNYLVKRLKGLGLNTLLMDISMRADAPSGADIPPE